MKTMKYFYNRKKLLEFISYFSKFKLDIHFTLDILFLLSSTNQIAYILYAYDNCK